VIPEAVGQAAMRVMGNDQVVTLAAQNGQLELNAFLPLLADALLDSLSLLEAASIMVRTRCVEGLSVDEAACRRQVAESRAVVTALLPRLGYETATEVAVAARDSDRSVIEIVLERRLIEPADLERLLSANAMTALGTK
jgi:aspartate ammonia-lyase